MYNFFKREFTFGTLHSLITRIKSFLNRSKDGTLSLGTISSPIITDVTKLSQYRAASSVTKQPGGEYAKHLRVGYVERSIKLNRVAVPAVK